MHAQLLAASRRGATLILLALSLAALSAPALASPLKQGMNEMKRALNGAMSSTTMPEFARYAAQLQDGASAASHANYPSDPATYRQGMLDLQKGIERMNAAIKANDLAAAKSALASINTSKKHYHDLLN